MSEALVQKAKRAILHDIRKTLPGTGNLEIVVESHGGVEYFRQALELPEVREALREKRITASIREIQPLSQIKQQILEGLRSYPRSKTELIFQTYKENADLYYEALKLPEVKREMRHRDIKVGIQVVDKFGRPTPDIVIATLNDVVTGKLDHIL